MSDNASARHRDAGLRLRPASVVMDLERLGRLYPCRLSFMRTLLRRVMKERWRIEAQRFELDESGFGNVIYAITTPHGRYSFVVFAHYLDPTRRSDRVIAEQWDLTATLCAGDVDDARLQRLRENVPLQEQGRLDANCLVLSRANRSSHNFETVVAALAEGRQPTAGCQALVGYLHRTTAVYGSGKFGMADWHKVRDKYPDFSRPFAAEMFTCWMIREFSLDQAEWIARQRAPQTAVPLQPDVRRGFGIGNVTGLGMAPYLIRHPLLIARWIEVRETALARVLRDGKLVSDRLDRLRALIEQACRHLREIESVDDAQTAINQRIGQELEKLLHWLNAKRFDLRDWNQLCEHDKLVACPDTQELVHALLIELYPELVDDLADELGLHESYELEPAMTVGQLRLLIETKYDWALTLDFSQPHSTAVFWYRSQEKMEPRLGRRGSDAGEEWELDIDVARSVSECYAALCRVADENEHRSVASFLFAEPQLRSIVRRVQTMAATRYGDIRANLLDEEVLPLHLLRCKLSLFGVARFDPRSRLWVRNTMFQGAPLRTDIGCEAADDWYFHASPVPDA